MADAPPLYKGVFVTNDSGMNWTQIDTSYFYCMYAVDSDLFFTTSLIELSTDTDKTRSVVNSNSHRIIGGNSEDLVIGNSKGYVSRSFDRGTTWRSLRVNSQADFDAFWDYVMPHTNFITLAAENGPGRGSEIWTSADGGATWLLKQSFAESGSIGHVAGDGCVIYVQRAEDISGQLGILRSTDFGQTWINIGGPSDDFDCRRISVIGHGAVVYAANNFNNAGTHTLYKTTDGGNGDLSPVVHIVVQTAHTLAAGSEHDTLVTKLCDSTSLSLWLQFTADKCDYGGLTNVTIDGLDSSTASYSIRKTKFPWSQLTADTAWISIIPKKPGTYPLTIHEHYTDDDFLGGDTTFKITLIINDNPGVLDLAAKPMYDFGVQSLCKPHVITDSFSVSGHGCEAVNVDSIVFLPVSGTGFTFKKVKSFIASDTQHQFRISFKPALAESDSGVIVIYSFDGTSHHTDTILARGSAVADARSFVISSDTLTTRMCDSVGGTVTLQNPTCNQMELDSISLPPGLTLLSKLPAMLDTSSTTTLSIRLGPGTGLAPLHLGDTALAIRLHVVGTSSFDTTVMLHVHISRGIPAMTLLTNSLNFDSVSTCSSKRLAVLIQSTGCDTLHCNSTISKSAFLLERPFSSALPVGSTDTVWITFASQTPGLFFDTLTITTNVGKALVPLQAYAMADVAALTGGSLALPQVFASCGGDTGRIDLPNLSCKSIVIDSVAGICTPFQVLSGIGDTILSSGSGRLIVSYIPQNAGSDDCTVRVYYHGLDGIPHDTTFALSASAIAPPRLNVHLVQAGLSASNQGHVTIPIRVNASSGIAGPETIAFRLNMRTDLLTSLSVTSPIVGAYATTTQSDYSGVSISIALPSGFAILADTVIATVDCKAFVTDTMQTTITLTQPSITSREQCVSLDSVSPAITFDLNPSCGDSLLTFYIGHRSFAIENIRPNPARDEIEVKVSAPDNIQAELYDVLGNATSPPLSTLNGTAFSINVSNLRNGVYYLRLKQDGYSQSRRVVINR